MDLATVPITTQTWPKQGGTRRQGCAEQNFGLHAVDASGDHAGHVNGGRVEHAGFDEGRERRDVVAKERTGRLHAGPSVPSRRSLSAVTSAGGTRQLKIPCGFPSTAGVSAPAMPRTKR